MFNGISRIPGKPPGCGLALLWTVLQYDQNKITKWMIKVNRYHYWYYRTFIRKIGYTGLPTLTDLP